MTDPLKFHWYLPTHGDTTTIADNRGNSSARTQSHLEPTLENLTALSQSAEISASKPSSPRPDHIVKTHGSPPRRWRSTPVG